MGITETWIAFVRESVLKEPYKALAQERAFMSGLVMEIPGKEWKRGLSHTLSDLGYEERGTKMKQLYRDYCDTAAVEEAKKVMATRADQEVSSIGIPTLAGEKKRTAQGHCIRTIVISHYDAKVNPSGKPYLRVDILYRTTELLRKFGADLIFLYKFIPELLESNPWGVKVPNMVSFYFPACFFSGLFIPVFYRFTDPVDFLQRLKEGVSPEEIHFYKRCFFRTKTMLDRDVDHYKFRSRRNMHLLAQRFLDEGWINEEGIREYIKNEEV